MTVPGRLRALLESDGHHCPPYPESGTGGRGIVICAGGARYTANAFVSLRFLRKVSSLPVELFHAGPEEMPESTRLRLESDFAPLTVRDVSDPSLEAEGPSLPVSSYQGFQIKPFALLRSRFEEVVLLDADNIPLQDPGELFDSTAYSGVGALFWPDLPEARYSHPDLLALFNVTDPALLQGPEFESGQMVLDRRRCWDALFLTALIHSDREGIREWCFERALGDKDLFRMAFQYLGIPYHLVDHTPDVIGTRMVRLPLPTRRLVRVQHHKGTFDHTGLLQMDLEGRPLFIHKTVWEWQPCLQSEQMRYRVGPDGRHEEAALLREVEEEGYGYLADFRRRYLPDFGPEFRMRSQRWINLGLSILVEGALRLRLITPGQGPLNPKPNGIDDA